MRSIITEPKIIRSLVEEFNASLFRHFKRRGRRLFAFPGYGVGEKTPFYIAEKSYGTVSLGIPRRGWGERKPFLFNIDPRETGSLSPDVEINFPIGLSRNTGACFVRETEYGEALVCHRGKFNAFKGMIPFKVTHRFFQDDIIEVEDGDRIAKVIPITQLGSSQTVYDIFRFAKRVLELKTLFKNNKGRIPANRRNLSDVEWWDNDEFEGTISRKADAATKNYSYLHGTIRNRLREFLAGIISTKFSLKRNSNVDLAILKGDHPITIFEIKTSGSYSTQLYKAIGQLFCYRSFYSRNNRALKLFLVIPAEFYDDKILSSIFRALGIHIILYDQGDFFFPDGKLITSASVTA